MENQSTPAARRNAKTLRSSMTDAERRLWSRLRRDQLGAKFRRQHPLGPYVADFACLEPRLVIEVDGSQHLDAAAYDARRDAWRLAQGFRVLRFWANDVMRDIEAVASRIQQTLVDAGAPAPTPTLPQRGREKRPRPLLPPLGESRDGDRIPDASNSRLPTTPSDATP